MVLWYSLCWSRCPKRLDPQSLKELREDSQGPSEVLAVACVLMEGYALNPSCLSSPRP